MVTRYLLLQLVALALVAAAVYLGWPQGLFAADATYLTVAIAVLGVVGGILPLWPAGREWLRWVVDHGVPVSLGLLGTVLGMWAAVDGMVAGNEAAKLAGAGSALTTTIAGVVVQLYLLLLERVTNRRPTLRDLVDRVRTRGGPRREPPDSDRLR